MKFNSKLKMNKLKQTARKVNLSKDAYLEALHLFNEFNSYGQQESIRNDLLNKIAKIAGNMVRFARSIENVELRENTIKNVNLILSNYPYYEEKELRKEIPGRLDGFSMKKKKRF